MYCSKEKYLSTSNWSRKSYEYFCGNEICGVDIYYSPKCYYGSLVLLNKSDFNELIDFCYNDSILLYKKGEFNVTPLIKNRLDRRPMYKHFHKNFSITNNSIKISLVLNVVDSSSYTVQLPEDYFSLDM